MVVELKCPQCKALCQWEDNRWRPFCSERCRLIDLGSWIDEEYRVAGKKPMEMNVDEMEN
ncbi:MAG: DNA gyrase inhibitor YacG [Deltaproteobacteria bacterium]|nr:DNA gyrase inhibitor YacG [Deltaproteobacteria bacterium]